MNMKNLTLAAFAAAALAACGSGGDGEIAPAATPVTPAAPTLTLTGTAATGAAIVGGQVAAKCAAGSGSATTSATGAYTMAITNGALPCALRVTTSDGTVLHSVQPGAGATTASFNVNVTPLTEMVLAAATGQSPASFFDAMGSTTAMSDSAVNDALATVKAALSAVADLGSTNPLSDELVAATSSSAGNPHDQKIDAVMAAVLAYDAVGQAIAKGIKPRSALVYAARRIR